MKFPIARPLKWLVLAALFVGVTGPISNLTASPAWAEDVTRADVEREANAGNFGAAYRLLVQLAESGHAQAQGFLAYVLYEGEWGVAVDAVNAKKWMRAAYAQNDAYARLFVGLTNAPDHQEALAEDSSLIQSQDWQADIRVAAEHGHPYAQHMMGDWAKEKFKYTEAIEWYRKAAEPDRDYYAVDKLLTQSWYTYPKYFRFEAVKELDSSGNGVGYAALSVAHTFGFNAVVDYKEAYIYNTLSAIFGGSTNVEAKKVFLENIPESERRGLTMLAFDRLQPWIDEPDTYIGKAMVWCLSKNDESIACISASIQDHRVCEADYMLWNFKNFIEFPVYQACRKDLYE